MENTQNETHFLRILDISDFEGQYRMLSEEHKVRMTTTPAEGGDVHYTFYGTEEQMWMLVSDTGHDQEDVDGAVIELGEVKNL